MVVDCHIQIYTREKGFIRRRYTTNLIERKNPSKEREEYQGKRTGLGGD